MSDIKNCPHCQKKLADENGARMHIRAKHPGKKNPFDRKAQAAREDYEESFAERAINAQIDAAMGVYNEDQDWLI